MIPSRLGGSSMPVPERTATSSVEALTMNPSHEPLASRSQDWESGEGGAHFFGVDLSADRRITVSV